MQIISTGHTVRSNAIQGLKEFNSQSLSIPAKKGEKLVSMMPAIEKVFDLMGDEIVELSTETETLKNQLDDFVKKWLAESKGKILEQIDDENRANLIMSRMQ